MGLKNHDASLSRICSPNPGAGGISAPADFATGKYGLQGLGPGLAGDSPASGQVFDNGAALRTSGTNVARTERAEARTSQRGGKGVAHAIHRRVMELAERSRSLTGSSLGLHVAVEWLVPRAALAAERKLQTPGTGAFRGHSRADPRRRSVRLRPGSTQAHSLSAHSSSIRLTDREPEPPKRQVDLR